MWGSKEQRRFMTDPRRSKRFQLILQERILGNATRSELAREMRISPERARQLEAQMMRHLRMAYCWGKFDNFKIFYEMLKAWGYPDASP